jgi:PAS domain S-box-containing protein
MSKINEDKIKILNILKDNIKDPFVALDQNGNIILFNKEAEGLLLLEQKQTNIFDLFEDKSAEKINDLFQSFFASNSPITDSIQLELNTGVSFNSGVTLNGIIQKDEAVLLLTLKLESYQFAHTGKTNLQVKVNGLDKIVHNKFIIDILNEVKSKFPLTFVNKEAIRKKLNECKEPLWIKDLNGNLILVNRSVAASLKLKSSQVEGKNESVFIPFHLVDFQKAVDKFIQESLNFVILEGSLVLEPNATENWETIEIPLCDVSNRAVAIVGIVQEKKELAGVDFPKEEEIESKSFGGIDVKFDSLLSDNPYAVVIVNDENLEIINANEKAVELYNYEKKEFLSKDLSDLYSPEDVQTILEQSEEDKTGKRFYGPVAHKKKGGVLIYVEVCKISFKKEEHPYSFYLIKEVTDEVEHDADVQTWRSVYLNTSDFVFTTDSAGFIISFNNNVTNLLEYKREELLNSSFASFFTSDDRAKINRDVFNSEEIKSTTLNLNIKKGDASYLPVNFTFSPIYDYKQKIKSYVINGKPQQPENNVREESGSVENIEIGSGKSLTKYIGDIFHEILTPVNVILGFTNELIEDESDVSKEKKEIVEIVKQNKSFLLQAMNSSVELSNLKYDKLKFNISEMKIPEIVDELSNDFKEIKGERDVEFAFGKISSSLSFESDKNKFYTLIYNLLLMGARLTKEKKIYLSASQIDEQYFSISISDGYSSSSNYLLEKFYKIFHDEDISEVKNDGVSKITARLVFKLINILQGKVNISKANNNVSNIDFIFPVEFKLPEEEMIEQLNETNEDQVDKTEIIRNNDEKKSQHHEETRKVQAVEEIKKENINAKKDEVINEKSAYDFSNLKCLYIEDQLDAQVLFKIEMNEFHETDFALSLEEALPLLEINNYDVIFVDINLTGDYNGLDALKMIRKFNNYGKSPIIAVSAYLIPGDKQKYISAGFDDFIAKPLSNEKINESFSRIFKDLISR